MRFEKKISIAVIRRLPKYFRYVSELISMDINRISSKELSEKMETTASQIRQDLNCFGGFGQQGYGYNVQFLHTQIGNILGVNNNLKFIIVGAGNLGRALANYTSFEDKGFKFAGIFDVDPNIIGSKVRNTEVLDFNKVDKFMKVNSPIHVAMLCIPKDYAFKVADTLANLGVKALWNFSPVDLRLIHDVVIENVHLSDSLMVLGYKLNQKLLEEKMRR